MKKRNVLILSIPTILATVALSSCVNANNNTKPIQDYSNVYTNIDSSTQKNIEKAFQEKFGKNLNWCFPEDVNSFSSIDELNKYVFSNTGYRPYAKFGDVYVLCEFSRNLDYTMEVSLKYEDTYIIYNNEVFGTEYHSTILYSNGTITMAEGDSINLIDYGISYQDALKIKEANDNYNKFYYEKFMISKDKSIEDAYNRIVSSFDEKEDKTTTTKTNA